MLVILSIISVMSLYTQNPSGKIIVIRITEVIVYDRKE